LETFAGDIKTTDKIMKKKNNCQLNDIVIIM